MGEIVVCDICDRDYTNQPETGGFIFGSYAYCPACADHGLRNIAKYREERFIKARAKPDERFCDFVLRWRGGNNTISVITLP